MSNTFAALGVGGEVVAVMKWDRLLKTSKGWENQSLQFVCYDDKYLQLLLYYYSAACVTNCFVSQYSKSSLLAVLRRQLGKRNLKNA